MDLLKLHQQVSATSLPTMTYSMVIALLALSPKICLRTGLLLSTSSMPTAPMSSSRKLVVCCHTTSSIRMLPTPTVASRRSLPDSA